MPDKENTFVLKADGAMEYLIEAKDAQDMKSWIATIRYCMKTTPTSQMPSHSLDDGATSNPSLPNTSLISSTGSIAEASSTLCAPSSSTANTSAAAGGATLNNNNVNSTNNNQASTSQPVSSVTCTIEGFMTISIHFSSGEKPNLLEIEEVPNK